jgi:ACS family glucarate transporter-like MFS transporter
MSMLLYLDRYAFSPLTNTLRLELNLDKEQLGRAFSAFFFAYGLCQIPAGWLSDTFGARRMLAIYVAVWSIATACMGLVNGLFAILLVRIALGFSQAGAYPTAASIIKRWFPFQTRGLANSSVSMGGRAGGLIAFWFTAALMLQMGHLLGWQNGAWRIPFALYGSLGLVWVVVFVWLFRDSPGIHPRCNAEEMDLISPGGAKTAVSKSSALPPRQILFSREALLMCVIGFCVDVGWVFLVSWLPQYLMDTYGDYLKQHVGDEQVVAGRLTALTGFAGIVGTLLGGFATDRLVIQFGPIWGRRIPGVTAGVLVASLYLVAPHLPNVWWFVGAMAAVSLSIDFCLGSMWATYQDIGGRHVGSVLGLGNMCASFGSASYTWLAGSLADHHRWNTVFLLAAGAMIVATISWLVIDPTRPVDPADVA